MDANMTSHDLLHVLQNAQKIVEIKTKKYKKLTK